MTRLRSLFSFVFMLSALLAFFAGCYYAGVAHAAADVPDPVGQGQLAVDTAAALVAQHGPLLGGLNLLYAIAGYLLRRNATEHWIANGRWLAIITGASMVGGALLNWKLSGAPFEGVFTALLNAWALIMLPTVKTPAPAPTT